MGLRNAVARSASRHAHALVVEVPGSAHMRMAAERILLDRGWHLALSPADADVLVVCGEPGPELAEAVAVVWHQMPGPRVRVDVPACEELGARLDEAHAGLLDADHHHRDAHQRPTASELLAEEPGPRSGSHDDQGDSDHGSGGGHEQMDHDHHEATDHDDHEEMDHGGHEGHGDMDMSPGGISLAEGGEDRDGLEMDVLHVRLGPVLPHWPAGLVVRCTLQGDVIVEARAELVDGDSQRGSEPSGAARRVDNLASLLALAGWEDPAAEARRVRDAALDDDGDGPAGAPLARLSRKVRRARLLRWSLRGLRPVREEDVDRHGLPVEAVGDTYDRLLGMVDRMGAGATTHHGPTYSTAQLQHVLTGLDLATARLVLASLDIHHLRTESVEHEVTHG